MENSNLELYFKKFKTAIMILIGALVIFIACMIQIFPKLERINNIQDTTKTQSETLSNLEKRLQELQIAEAESHKDKTSELDKPFFKAISGGNDTETAIADEFEEILQIIRDNKIKVRAIKTISDPKEDEIVKNVGYKYHVCKVNLDMIANYANLENFLRDLYKHEHLLAISDIKIKPYEKNKRILLANVQVKLFAERRVELPKPVPVPETSNNEGNGDNNSQGN